MSNIFEDMRVLQNTVAQQSVHLTLGTARRACAHPKYFSRVIIFGAGRLCRSCLSVE